ncbi:hypothetical protein GCM10008025_18590 [Ornithinibacillus halotolerans]|uniref:Uncharacterized protein n=1 Tax=Ornithinibacillus halotolerans TaxID=1274357 RepID=A0A916RXH9_9BACI|nr:hypothetical protein GCM10008025_18590 [Ornithinibacillus halotolerans]
MICIGKDTKNPGFLLEKTREIIGIDIEKAKDYFNEIGIGLANVYFH